jgi:hypothetical protein
MKERAAKEEEEDQRKREAANQRTKLSAKMSLLI